LNLFDFPGTAETCNNRRAITVSSGWAASTNWEIVCRRAAGRKRYHAARQSLQAQRWSRIVCRLSAPPWPRGLQSKLARELGCSKSTISRDFKALEQPGSLELLRKRLNYTPRFCGPRDSNTARADDNPAAVVEAAKEEVVAVVEPVAAGDVGAAELLQRCWDFGLGLSVLHGRLIVYNPKAMGVPPDLQRELRQHEVQIVALLPARCVVTGVAEPARPRLAVHEAQVIGAFAARQLRLV
jgi:hypothetical protein